MHLRYAEFYITNVCNLNCTNCNRFNNFNFTGHYKHLDHYNDYLAWSSVLEIEEISILGGEPTLNPHFIDWVSMVRELWPVAKINVVTNGTQLKRHSGLYQLLKDKRILLDVSLHMSDYTEIYKSVVNLLGGIVYVEHLIDQTHLCDWKNTYRAIRGTDWPDCNHIFDFVRLPNAIKTECIEVFNFSDKIFLENNVSKKLTNRDGVTVILNRTQTHFHESALNFVDKNNITLRNSNPENAIKICDMKHCHHFVEGKLYKCGVVKILPDFIKQFKLSAVDSDLELLNSYMPANPYMPAEELAQYENNFKNGEVIPQCKFCPESFTHTSIDASNKKIILNKK